MRRRRSGAPRVVLVLHSGNVKGHLGGRERVEKWSADRRSEREGQERGRNLVKFAMCSTNTGPDLKEK
jgi:hypothetical protein